MPGHKRRTKSVVGVLIVIVCLLSFPTAAQQSGPQSERGSVSDDDLISLHQQIKELKNPTFRAFLRMRLLSWETPEPAPMRRRVAMEVAAQGVTDLCEHQDEVWSPTAAWLYRSLVKQIKTLQSPEDAALQICVLKTETANNSDRDFSSAIRMLSKPETSAAGLNSAKTAVLSGQVSPEALLGQLVYLSKTQSPYLSEVLGAVSSLEEKQPGTLPLRMMPFFSSMYLDKSVSPEVLKRFVFVAVRSSRRSAEELANPIVRSQVRDVLNGVIGPAKRLVPELYPEIAGRLSSLNGNAGNWTEARLAAEDRIQKASDQLEQLISEANSASDETLKKHFFFLAARRAQEQGRLIDAVDLATKATNERVLDNGSTSSWINGYLSEIVSLAINKKTPGDAIYAISKMTQTLAKAKAFRLLGEYYGANQDAIKSKEAFVQSDKQLKAVNSSVEKVRASLSLAESVLKYEPADSYEAFREAVKAINNLPSPEKDHETVNLLPIAEDLVRSFRLLAARESQTATSLAAEIKLSELRLSALIGAHSAFRSSSKTLQAQVSDRTIRTRHLEFTF
jgi:hypothetical protein